MEIESIFDDIAKTQWQAMPELKMYKILGMYGGYNYAVTATRRISCSRSLLKCQAENSLGSQTCGHYEPFNIGPS
jgi:hypothetical protein